MVEIDRFQNHIISHVISLKAGRRQHAWGENKQEFFALNLSLGPRTLSDLGFTAKLNIGEPSILRKILQCQKKKFRNAHKGRV